MPVFLECQRCTACCRWPGEVRLTDAEIIRLSGHLSLTEASFIERYTRLRRDRRGLSLQERPDHSCVFLEGKACAVQEVKPQQCRDFPNLWHFPDANNLCRAVPREVSPAEYVRLIRLATGRKVLPPRTADSRSDEA